MFFFKPTRMSEYWIGEDVDYDGVWDAYETGAGYIEKFRNMRVHLLRITLREQPEDLPLFNFEAVYKTFKGYFYDMKRLCLTAEEFGRAGPLFIYRVNRSSGVWDVLGEVRQLLMFGTSLADQKMMGEKISNLDKRMEFLRKNFGDSVHPEDFQRFMMARTPRQLDRALKRLFAQGIQKVQLSSEPFVGNIQKTESALIDVEVIS